MATQTQDHSNHTRWFAPDHAVLFVMFLAGLIGAFVNLTAVVEHLVRLGEDFLILCAGQDKGFCLEDAVCAGKILAAYERASGATLIPDDSASAALALEKAFGKNVHKMLKQSAHGTYLTEIGFGDDLAFCAQVDEVPVLPLFAGTVIRAQKDSTKS